MDGAAARAAGSRSTVGDEGIGIPREEQERIFEKFYRVGRSETQGRRGSGVGLALVRHVAEAHGGRVTRGEPAGRGQPLHALAPALAGQRLRRGAGMPRILIVDDEPEMVRGLEDNLRFEGYQTLAAGDGQEGLDARAVARRPTWSCSTS